MSRGPAPPYHRALGIGLGALGTLLLVAMAALASAHLLRDSHARALTQQAERGAAATARLFERESDATRLLMQQVCTRDVSVERHASEGPVAPFTADDVQGLRRVLGGEVWIVSERAGSARRIALSADFATAPPSLEALRAASAAPRTFVGSSPLVMASCARQLSDARLWIVRVEPLEALVARLAPAPPLRVISEADAARDEEDDEHADARALRIEGADTAPAFSLWLRAREAPPIDALIAYAPPLLLLLVFGALLSYFAVVRQGVDDSVLLELEAAATRVAGGDLSARIERRPGGRADQTFQTFDRMTAELRDMRSKLADAERIAAWQDMARRIAHEIKNPLSPIQLAIETLRKAHAKQLHDFDEIFEESTRAILEEVRRMERIVREFSEFARLPRAQPGGLALDALVDDTVALYRPDEVHVSVIRERDHDDFALRGDREQLTQVLVNLLQNAFDAARSACAPAVEIRLAADEDGFSLHIDDNGPGIALADRERVFEPYVTTKPEGTGLGLAIARRIVVDHGGSIEASDSPLGGARITVRLPRA